MVKESTFVQKFGAYWGLVGVQLIVAVLIRIASVNGKVKFSTASAFVMSETVKLLISLSLLVGQSKYSGSIISKVYTEMINGSTKRLVLHSCFLGILYCINNNLQFYLYMWADGATIFLCKSFSTILSTLILKVFVQRQVSSMQWLAVFLQVMGLIIVQYDPCKGTTIYSFSVYILITISVVITSVAGVVNELLLKSLSCSMHVQNIILYGFGVWFNLIMFFIIPPPGQENQVGFFENFGFVAMLIVIANGFVGVAITAVYKYADVIVKTFATASITCLLMIIDIMFFDYPFNLTKFMGCGVVFTATYLYMTNRVVEPSSIITEKELTQTIAQNDNSKMKL